MNPQEFDYISNLLKQRSGLSITKDKMYLVESRLQPVARVHGLNTLSDLVGKLMRSPDPVLMSEVVQAMTTNETMFFRDLKPFMKMREKILPHWLEKHPGRKHLRIWSAACSSGQEPYTLAMCLQEESAKLAGFTIDIIATDLSEKIVNKATQGVYSQFEVQRGLPIQMLLKYFTQAQENTWRVNDHTKRMVRFQTHNLLEDCSRLGAFDIVYCRNVLIYFDEATKQLVLNRIASVLNPPGFLVLGSAETVFGLNVPFQPFENEPGIYTLKHKS
jgi:chemotaxis protein methyltransferase CheR